MLTLLEDLLRSAKVKMNGQGDIPDVARNIFIFFRQPVFGVPALVDMNFRQRHGMVAREELGHLDGMIVNDDNINNHNIEDAGPSAEFDVGINQCIENEDPVPGGSRRRPREEEDDDEETSSKRLRWWDEFADSDSDSCFDSDVSSTGYESDDSDEDDKVTEEEVDPLPGATRKRERDEEEEDEDERSAKKFRQ